MTSFICDFCSSGVPVASYSAADFVLAGGGGASFGGWMACRICDDLIRRDDWDGLAERSASMFERKHQTGTSHEELVRNLHDLHTQVRAQMSGERIEVSATQPVTKVRVLSYEDGQLTGEINMRYFEGQEYVVQVVTPDGVDGQIPRKAGLA